nr:hypothetical protein [Tanacetum cinerariifolium]
HPRHPKAVGQVVAAEAAYRHGHHVDSEAQRGRGFGQVHGFLEVDGAPVVHGALAGHRGEGDGPEAQQRL